MTILIFYKIPLSFTTFRSQKLEYRREMYKLRENRDIKPEAFMNLVSSMLYEKR